MLGLFDVTRTSRVRSLTARKLPLAVEGYLVYCSTEFKAFLAEKLDDMGFKSSTTDPDVWMIEATTSYGDEYYNYILVYVDYLLVISSDVRSVILEVAEKFKLNYIQMLLLCIRN